MVVRLGVLPRVGSGVDAPSAVRAVFAGSILDLGKGEEYAQWGVGVFVARLAHVTPPVGRLRWLTGRTRPGRARPGR